MDANVTHFYLFEGEDLDIFDEEHANTRIELLTQLATEPQITKEVSNFLRKVVPLDYGEPHEHQSTRDIWAFRTTDAHGNEGMLRIVIPHDVHLLSSLQFIPPCRGTWVDEQAEFNQDSMHHDNVIHFPSHGDRTGGKAIAMKLLQQIKK